MEGQEIEIYCTVDSTPSPVVYWFKDGGLLSTADPKYDIETIDTNRYRLTINTLTQTDGGTYTCLINNTIIPATTERNFTLIISSKCSSNDEIMIYILYIL